MQNAPRVPPDYRQKQAKIHYTPDNYAGAFSSVHIGYLHILHVFKLRTEAYTSTLGLLTDSLTDSLTECDSLTD